MPEQNRTEQNRTEQNSSVDLSKSNQTRNSKMAICKHCGAEIAASAKTCPKCGGENKPSFFKGCCSALVIVFGVFFIIGIISSSSKQPDREQEVAAQVENRGAATESVSAEKPKAITYTSYNVDELVNDLEKNALKASKKYKGQYVKLTGALKVIDSDGRYFSLEPLDGRFTMQSVRCDMNSDEQRNIIADVDVGDVLIVKGKITDVGEIMGYSFQVETITKK